jgi:hypothetical protein
LLRAAPRNRTRTHSRRRVSPNDTINVWRFRRRRDKSEYIANMIASIDVDAMLYISRAKTALKRDMQHEH